MALLNKLGEIVKSAAEKTEELTKTLGEKAEAVSYTHLKLPTICSV